MSNIEPIYTELRIRGLQKKYRLMQVTDLHMTDLAGNESPERIENGTFRSEKMFDWQGFRASDRLYDYFDFAKAQSVDEMVLTGDIIDFPSEPNLEKLHDAIQKSGMRYLYVLGNHDWAYPDDYHTENAKALYWHRLDDLCGGDREFFVQEFEDKIFAGFDNSSDFFSARQCEELAKLNAKGKPILLFFHVPFTSPTLDDTTVAVWHGHNISLGENGILKGETAEFIKIMTSPDSMVRGIICGHLHFHHEDTVCGKIPQIITAVGSEGNCRIIDLIPES